VNTPSHGSNGSDGCKYELDDEQILQPGWRNEEQRQLNEPVEKVRDHSHGADTTGNRQGVFGTTVVVLEVRRPESGDHTCHGLSAVCTLNSKPEHGQDAS